MSAFPAPRDHLASRGRDRIRGLFVGSRVSRWRTAAGLALVGALVVGIDLLVLAAPLKDDVAWLLYVTEQTLGGRTLYIDLVEINPPLIILLSTAPIGLARELGIGVAGAYVLLVSVVLLAAAGLVGAILARAPQLVGRPGLAAMAVIGALFLLPGQDFGERDHLVVALLLPWLVLLAARAAGARPARASSWAAGAMAAMAIGLKPHYVLVVLAGEAWSLRRGIARRRPETLALVAGLALYGAVVVAWFPAYLTEVLPLALQHYDAGDVSLMRLIMNARQIVPPLAIVLLLAVIDRRWLADPLVTVLLLAGVAAALVYFLQAKGWPYHRIPADVLVALLGVAWLERAMTDDRRPRGRGAHRAVLATAVALGLLGAAGIERQKITAELAWRRADSPEAWLAGLVRRTGADSILGFSERLEPFFPVVLDTGVRWTSRYGSMWALRGELRHPAGLRGYDRILTQVVDDFVAGRPALVLVDESAQLNYPALLGQDPRFAAAWAHYHLVDAAHGLQAFRRDPGAG